jgi:molybdopterin adenylyltransferase
LKAAVVTVSSSVARGESDDLSGPALAELCERAGLHVVRETVSDDRGAIAAALRRLADEEGVRFVFTTGGTGMTPDDVTPEATRGVSGIRGRTLIVNFPGNPKAIGQSWPVVEPTLEHAAETLERTER